MNINRVLLIYTALIATGILITSVRSSLSPSPNNKLEFDIAQIKETVDKMNYKSATAEGQLSQEIKTIKEQIALSSEDPAPTEDPKSAVLGKSAQTLGQIKVAQGYETLDIYEETSFSSAVSGKMEPGKSYSYTKKQDNWLLVKLDSNKEGWVNNKLVTAADSQGSP